MHTISSVDFFKFTWFRIVVVLCCCAEACGDDVDAGALDRGFRGRPSVPAFSIH